MSNRPEVPKELEVVISSVLLSSSGVIEKDSNGPCTVNMRTLELVSKDTEKPGAFPGVPAVSHEAIQPTMPFGEMHFIHCPSVSRTLSASPFCTIDITG